MNLTQKNKLQLHGFNNLTKNFACSAYLLSYVHNPQEQACYNQHINKRFSGKQLTQLLTEISQIIGATVLNIAQQEYQPQGCSVTLLVADQNTYTDNKSLVGHLDKSHLCIHTYPETHPVAGINTLRLDIEISTCGVISPLKAINFILEYCQADVLTLDYRIRGFTRQLDGKKLFIDHTLCSIQDFINNEQCQSYEMLDTNMSENNLYTTKLIKKKFDLNNYLFKAKTTEFNQELYNKISALLTQERKEIYYGKVL